MAKYTSRDRIWNAALKKEEPIYPSDLADRLDVGERTVRDTLEVMTECLYLKKRGGEGTERVRYISDVVDQSEL